MNTPLKSPQVAAVQQTLAGERLTMAVQFPTTGDSDCDFIQGILAVGKALDVNPSMAVRVLAYMLQRWQHEEAKAAKTYEVIRQYQMAQQAMPAPMPLPGQPWYGGLRSTATDSTDSKLSASQILGNPYHQP